MKDKYRSSASHTTRREFLKRSFQASMLTMAAPAIVPATGWGNVNPVDRINIGCIGVGRQCRGSDLREILEFDDVQVVAVCDVDEWRLQNAKKQVEDSYAEKSGSMQYTGCDTYTDYREMIARSDIDAVMICTPDHWHALPAMDAALAGKDIFIQKPLTLTIPEGRLLSDTVRRNSIVLQVGSQQRSDARFRFAAELVRNGRIGKLHTVKVGFGKDPFTGMFPPTPVPPELHYDMWLGPTPEVPYIEQRIHPIKAYSRPGWLRIKSYCCGMITGWGSHHLDSAHWGMDSELTGPVRIDGSAEYSKGGIWDVHGAFKIEYTYANDMKLICTDNDQNKQGVLFEGTDGWVYVRRGFIDAYPRDLLKETIGPNETRLYRSNNHKKNWLDCIRSRRQTVAPVEIGHRSGSACILGFLSMELDRPLIWDPTTEKFVDDMAANRLLSRPYRSPWHLQT